MRIAINGFGRIGRQVYKAMHELHPEKLEIVAVNDLTSPHTNAHLLKYDSTYGTFAGEISATDDSITVDGKTIKVFSESDPGAIPWSGGGIEVVVESTGFFTDANLARAHIDGGGAKKVIISAPAKNEDLTVVLGVNDDLYDPAKHSVLSNASCTTNCIAPVVKVLHDAFGVEKGFMTTIHAYTNDQVTLDFPHSDLRRARAAALSMIPTSTGAARAIGLVMPELKGKLDGFAMRVPTADVSVVDLVCELERDANAEEINEAFRKAANGPMSGILSVSDEPLVSIDFNHDPASSSYDATLTKVMDGTLVKVCSWYDNEWGFSNRMLDTTIALVNAK